MVDVEEDGKVWKRIGEKEKDVTVILNEIQ